jgi:aspartate oxidase
MTGREIERALLARCAANPNVRCLEDHMAVDLITSVANIRRARHVAASAPTCSTIAAAAR